jgi:hypothetical protein
MRLLHFTLIALLPWAAAPSAALRGVETGARCAGIPEIETALGSKLRGTSERQNTPAFNLHFDGSYHERASVISYICKTGAVTSQIIDTRFESEQEALVFFTDRHREFSEQFGPPYKDPDEPRIAEIADATDVPVRRFATWVLDKRVVSVMLSLQDGKQWQVLVSGP